MIVKCLECKAKFGTPHTMSFHYKLKHNDKIGECKCGEISMSQICLNNFIQEASDLHSNFAYPQSIFVDLHTSFADSNSNLILIPILFLILILILVLFLILFITLILNFILILSLSPAP